MSYTTTSRTPRQVMLRFLALRLSQKNEIVRRVELADDADRGLPDLDRFALAIRRAYKSGLLDKVDQAVNEVERQA